MHSHHVWNYDAERPRSRPLASSAQNPHSDGACREKHLPVGDLLGPVSLRSETLLYINTSYTTFILKYLTFKIIRIIFKGANYLSQANCLFITMAELAQDLRYPKQWRVSLRWNAMCNSVCTYLCMQIYLYKYTYGYIKYISQACRVHRVGNRVLFYDPN